MARKTKKAMVAPIILKPFNDQDDSVVHVVVETPKGCRNKYKFDPKLRSFKLSRVLPDGMLFPYDFGFIPSTQADDGDPIDVLLLMDAPAFTGCVIDSRLVGVIEGEQTENGKTERNDRLLAVAKQNHTYSDLKDISDINPKLLKELGEFFVNYHKQEGTKFRVLGTSGPKQARQLLKKSIKHAKAV
jgi:inorganic pyrophosphatase